MAGWFTKLFGNDGERRAAKFLRRAGFRILARQYANRFGEVDLIALDGETVVFVEVKSRRSEAAGHPVEAVTHEKQKRLTRIALTYLKRRRWLERSARFDVVAVLWPQDAKEPQILHYRDAFPPVGFGQMFS
jgi:putative endonuclease